MALTGIGKIKGTSLESNLERNNENLSIETDLLFIDVQNSKIGVGLSGNLATDAKFEVNGNIRAAWVYAANIDTSGTDNRFAGLKLSSLTEGRIVFAGVDGELVDHANLTYNSAQSLLTLTGNQDITGLLRLTSTSALKIPVGTTNDKNNFTAELGQIRYNITDNQFEGYVGNNNWSSLGGVRSVDGLTYITAETSPNASDDILTFVVDGTSRMTIDTDSVDITENVAIDANTDITGILSLNSTSAMKLPVGNSLQRPTAPTLQTGMIRYNTQDNTFEGYDGSNWGSLGGVKSVDQLTYITAESSPGVSDDTLTFVTDNVTRMTIDTTDINVTNMAVHLTGTSTLTLDNQLTVANGGTGLTTVTQYGIVYGNTATALNYTANSQPGSNATTSYGILTTDENSIPVWTDILDGGSFS